MRLRTLFAVLILSVMAVGCLEDPEPQRGDTASLDGFVDGFVDAGHVPASSTTSIGPAGGVVAADGVLLRVPKGALGSDVEIHIERLSERVVEQLPGSQRVQLTPKPNAGGKLDPKPGYPAPMDDIHVVVLTNDKKVLDPAAGKVYDSQEDFLNDAFVNPSDVSWAPQGVPPR